MATAESLLNIARADLGYCEFPANSNHTKYGKWIGLDYQPWCMSAVQYWCDKANVSLPLKTGSCTLFMNAAKKTGKWVTSGYRAGDIILYNFDSRPDADHVGICESAASSTVTCIEGNTSTTSQDNGGKVMRRIRNIYLVLGAYRPDYETTAAATPVQTTTNTGGTCNVNLNMLSKGSKGSSVKALQILLIGYGYSCGSYGADGDFGSATDNAVRRFQSAKGIGVDGIVGTNTWTKLLK